MRQQAFLQWLGQLDRLTPRQRRQVSAKLNTILPKHASGSDTAKLIPPPDHCPHCLASALRPWGTSHGLARYRCKQCGRTCNALSGTALARLRHKDHWPNYAKALIQGESVRMAAQRCGVDKNTAFRWRHRFLRDAADHRAEQEAGIVEADETFFLESFKGQRSLPRPARSRGGVAHKRGINAEQIPVLVVRDRQGRTADFKLARLDAEHVQAVLAPLVARDAVLCTDSAGVYAAFARRYGITHRTINVRHGRRVVEGAFHIQNVNAYDSRLKEWMRRFHGVATKYLPNYLGWRRMLERYQGGLSPLLCLCEAVGHPRPQQVMQT